MSEKRQEATEKRLTMRTKLGYGTGGGSEAIVLVSLTMWILIFYNQVRGLSGTMTSLALMIALAFDAVSDPLIGSLSDRWHSKLGRRHPFMFVSAVPMGLCFTMVFWPPAALAGTPLFLWLVFWVILLRTFLTFFHVPWLALGAELTPNYVERSVIMSYPAIFANIFGALFVFSAWTNFSKYPDGARGPGGYPGLALIGGIFITVMIFLCAWLTRDQIKNLTKAQTDLPRFSARQLALEVWGTLKNRNYLMLLLGLFFLSSFQGIRESLGSYENLYFWEFPEKSIRYFPIAVGPAFFLAFAITSKLHAKFDKRETIMGAVALSIVASTLPILLRFAHLLPENGTPILLPLIMLSHFFFFLGVAILMISVMSALADIADENELTTGRRQEGIFYSARTFFSKLTIGLGGMIAGIAIDVIHFPENATPGEIPPDVIFNLGIVNGPIASIGAIIAIFFYGGYRINKKRHEEIRDELARKRAAVSQDT